MNTTSWRELCMRMASNDYANLGVLLDLAKKMAKHQAYLAFRIEGARDDVVNVDVLCNTTGDESIITKRGVMVKSCLNDNVATVSSDKESKE